MPCAKKIESSLKLEYEKELSSDPEVGFKTSKKNENKNYVENFGELCE